MSKTIGYSRDNKMNTEGVMDLHISWLNQNVQTTSNPTFNNVSTTGDVIVGGNLTVNGSSTVIHGNVVHVDDNIMVINAGQVGPGVTLNIAGIEVDRGGLTDFQSVWQESTQLYKIGLIG